MTATIGKLIAALLVLALIGWGFVTFLYPDDDVPPPAAAPAAAADECRTTSTVHVLSATSFSPVLAELAPNLESKGCLRLEVSVADGRDAFDRLRISGIDVWIPDDVAWPMKLGGDLLAPPGKGGSRVVLATSPIYQVTDRATAQRIDAAGGSWYGLSRLLAGTSGTRLVARDPASSGDGLIAAGSLIQAVWLEHGMDRATVSSVATRRVSREHTGPGPALPNAPGEVALVPEYALIPVLDSDAADLAVLPGKDRAAVLRFSWLPLAAATADPRRSEALERLLDALTGSSADAAVATAGLRRPDGPAPPGASTERLPALVAPPFDPLVPHRVDHVFAAWYPEERQANLLLVVDVSGSMREPAPGTDRPLIRLVAGGVSSVVSLLPPSSRLGLWEFGSKLDPPHDHRVLVRSGDLSSPQRAALRRAVRRLSATRSGTGLNDTILAAYRAAVKSYQPGMPNQVLVFTDAVNEDDPGGISARKLARALRSSADPDRPVALAVAAFGKKSDKGLAKALKSVNGSLVRVEEAQDVNAVFVHAAVGGLR